MNARTLAAALLTACAIILPARADGLGFAINLKLSEGLKAELASKGETIIVRAAFYGEPSEAGASEVDEMGQIPLGDEELSVLPVDGAVMITGTTVPPAKLALIAGAPSVNVNVFTGRKSSGDNLISCNFIDGPVAELTAAPTEIACGLITENPVTVMKPAKG
jgi:hypothetical protein